jgi:hypothetical protein
VPVMGKPVDGRVAVPVSPAPFVAVRSTRLEGVGESPVSINPDSLTSGPR